MKKTRETKYFRINGMAGALEYMPLKKQWLVWFTFGKMPLFTAFFATKKQAESALKRLKAEYVKR